MGRDQSQTILVKCEEDTNPKFGCPPKQRPLLEYLQHGIVNIDKPSGPTSHQVSTWVRDIFGFKKAGHSGTLDPKVTGVLPIALEKATRVLQALLLSRKVYVGALKLHHDIPIEKLKTAMRYFEGEIYQRPPLKSAVKRQLRIRRIYEFRLMEMDGRKVLFRAECESGSYVRKLCHDLGLYLGCGASMHDLRRIRAGPFDESTMVTLHDLRDAWEFYKEDGEEEEIRKCVKPMEMAVEELNKIWVKDSAVDALCHGSPLHAPGVVKLTSTIKPEETVAILTLKGELIALAKSLYSSSKIMELKHGEIAKLQRVYMSPGVYPRQWGG